METKVIYNRTERAFLRKIKKGKDVFYSEDLGTYAIVYMVPYTRDEGHIEYICTKYNIAYAHKEHLRESLGFLASRFEELPKNKVPNRLHFKIVDQWRCGDYIEYKDKIYEIDAIENKDTSYKYGCEKLRLIDIDTGKQIEEEPCEVMMRILTDGDLLRLILKRSIPKGENIIG